MSFFKKIYEGQDYFFFSTFLTMRCVESFFFLRLVLNTHLLAFIIFFFLFF